MRTLSYLCAQQLPAVRSQTAGTGHWLAVYHSLSQSVVSDRSPGREYTHRLRTCYSYNAIFKLMLTPFFPLVLSETL